MNSGQSINYFTPSQRQNQILNHFLKEDNTLKRSDLEVVLLENPRTLNRDLNLLVDNNLLTTTGKGKNTSYSITTKGRLKVVPEPDLLDESRLESNKPKVFNFALIDEIREEDIFTPEEMSLINDLTEAARTKYDTKSLIANPDATGAESHKELERLIVEFSWKSSQIEGNTYSLLDTEKLLSRIDRVSTEQKYTQAETNMILNHKEAFKYIVNNPSRFQTISKKQIMEIHYLLVKDLNIQGGLRKHGVGITGSLYRPLDNPYQIEDALEAICVKFGKMQPVAQALLVGLFIAYIQPFADGNKRTSRLVSNAILLANNLPLLPFRSVSMEQYRDAVISFYEYNCVYLYKQLFIEQLQYFVDFYF